MKRGRPPRRFAPLRSKASLARGERLGASPSPKTTLRPPEPPELAASRVLVRERSGGRCELAVTFGCRGKAEHLHHRKPRRHGDHRPVNLLDCCDLCHSWVHRNPAESYRDGFLVHGWQKPEDAPILRVPSVETRDGKA